MQGFFFRVAALAFENCILKDMENGAPVGIGRGDTISKQRLSKDTLICTEILKVYKNKMFCLCQNQIVPTWRRRHRKMGREAAADGQDERRETVIESCS